MDSNNILNTLLPPIWISCAIGSLFASCYEYHICSEKYARKRIAKGLPPEKYGDGQLYLEFMKDYY
jgi:hypothetical protein